MRRGVTMWQNRKACVDHPPPCSFGHLAVRALAHGRDHYMAVAEGRSVDGLRRSLRLASQRMGRGTRTTLRAWRRVGLKRWEIPAALAILASYYGFFALGGVLTHVSPSGAGRHWRV
jgi:hypothetical protein